MYTFEKPIDSKNNDNVTLSVMYLHLWNGNGDKFISLLEKTPKRIGFIESMILSKTRLESNGKEIKHAKLLEMVWDKWGIPDEGYLREIIKRFIFPEDKTSLGEGYLKIESVWNYNHPKWTEKDDAHHFIRLVLTKRHQKIKEDVENGWKIPYEYLKKIKGDDKLLKELEIELEIDKDTINYVYEKMDVYETKEKMSGIYKGKGKKKQWKM